MSFPLFVTFTEKATGKEIDIDCQRIVTMRNLDQGGTALELDTLSKKFPNGKARRSEMTPDVISVEEHRPVVKGRISSAVLEDNLNYERMKNTMKGGPS